MSKELGCEIGIPGTIGFGVGICPVVLEGFTPLPGCGELGSDNYGNYQYADGSVMVWIPKFYYKIGTGKNGLPVNDVSIKGALDFEDTIAANASGYALHRAFLDGGLEQPGFFVDKFLCSKNAVGTGFIASSIADAPPLSTYHAHNPIGELTATAGVNSYYACIDAAHARDGINGEVNPDSIFFCSSRFIFAALALLSMAHGQASADNTICAWYDPTGKANHPKGCNNWELGDCNDKSISYTSDGFYDCGRTGSGRPFARTAHNGQANGAVDLNGLMWEVNLGLITVGKQFYAARPSARMAAFTSGNAKTTDHWGSASAAENYDAINPVVDPQKYRLGNGKQQVLSADPAGEGWQLTGLGMPRDNKAISRNGSSRFGKNIYYSCYVSQELCALSGADWGDGSPAGVWALALNNNRSNSLYYVGFRCACYLVR